MTTLRAFKILAALILGAALPSLLALAHYAITGDPSLRPLGLTQSALVRYSGQKDGNLMRVRVLWGGAAPYATSRDEVRRLLEQALLRRAIEADVQIQPAVGRDVVVYFDVGAVTYGPYPITDAARGVSVAAAAWSHARAR